MTKIRSAIDLFFLSAFYEIDRVKNNSISTYPTSVSTYPYRVTFENKFDLHIIINTCSFEVALGYKLSAGTKLLNKIASLMN